MTDTTLNQFPTGAAQHPLAPRWVTWFARYIDTRGNRRRRRLSRRQLEAMDPRILADAGISQAQRFIAVNQPSWEL